MGASALQPAAAAVFALLPSIAGGWHDDTPQGSTYPVGLYVLRERNIGGLGLRRGPHELELETHTYSQYPGKLEAQLANAAAVDALEDAVLDLPAAFRQGGKVVFEDVTELPEQVLNGVKVHEVVSRFRFWIEDAPS